MELGRQKKCLRCEKVFARNKKYSDRQWAKARFCCRRCGSLKRDTSVDQKICDKYLKGRSCQEISREHGFSDTHIARILRENGILVDPYKLKSGGLSVTSDGYIRFDDSGSNGKHAGRKLHRVLMEMKLGRPITPKEIVHHIDGDKLNNHPDNLTVMSRGEHSALHHRERRNGK